MATITKNTQDRINVWKNNIPELKNMSNDYSLLNKHRRKIYNFIMTHKYSNNKGEQAYSNNSKGHHLITLSKLIRPYNDKSSLLYSKEATNLKKSSV